MTARSSLQTICLGLAVCLLGLIFFWYGWGEATRPVPALIYPLQILGHGALNTPEYHFLAAGALVGFGSALSSETVVGAVRQSLPSIALLILSVLLLILLTTLFGGGQRQLTSFQLAGLLVALVVLTITVVSTSGIAAVAGSAAVACALHLIEAHLDSDHRSWFADRSKYNLPRDPRFDVYAAIGLLLVVAIAYVAQPILASTATPDRENIEQSKQPAKKGPVMRPGEEHMKYLVLEGDKADVALAAVAGSACDLALRKKLRGVAIDYLVRTVEARDWKHAESKSEQVRRARTIVEHALVNGYLTWDDVGPRAVEYLNKDKFASASYAAYESLDCAGRRAGIPQVEAEIPDLGPLRR